MKQKTCTVCEIAQDLDSFRFSKNGKYDVHSICRPCEWKQNRLRRDEKRKAVQNYKLEKGCAECGYNKNPYALQLNHLDPNNKHGDQTRSAYRTEWGWPRIWKELAKCEVLCANCHAVKTHEGGKFYDSNPARDIQKQASGGEVSRHNPRSLGVQINSGI